MIFTRRFFILFALGVLPLVVAWGAPGVKWGLIVYDLILLLLAYVDYNALKTSRRLKYPPHAAPVHDRRRERSPDHGRPPISAPVTMTIKDEYPSGLELRGERLLLPRSFAAEPLTARRRPGTNSTRPRAAITGSATSSFDARPLGADVKQD